MLDIKKILYQMLILEPNILQKLIPAPGTSPLSRAPNYLIRSFLSIILSWEIPRNLGCNFSHHVGIVCSDDAEIGRNTTIRQNTTIGINLKTQKAPKIGERCSIGTNCNIIGDTKIHDFVEIGAGCNIAESTIGEHTTIKMGCVITRSKIGKNCIIRSGVIMHGAVIPDNSIVEPPKVYSIKSGEIHE